MVAYKKGEVYNENMKKAILKYFPETDEFLITRERDLARIKISSDLLLSVIKGHGCPPFSFPGARLVQEIYDEFTLTERIATKIMGKMRVGQHRIVTLEKHPHKRKK